MPQSQARSRAEFAGARLLVGISNNARVLGLLLVLVLLLAGLLWLGGQVGQVALNQTRQEGQIKELGDQLRCLAEATGVSGKLSLVGGGPGPAPQAASPAKGAILAPRTEQAVASTFACTVRVDRPRQGHYYYLVLRQGQMCWPRQEVKMPPGGATTAWQISREAMPGQGHFCLELREVDEPQHLAITQWQRGVDGNTGLEPAGGLLDAINLY